MAQSPLWPLLLVLLACGRGGSGTAHKRDGGAPPADAAPVVLAPRTLGMPEVASFAYRQRAGQPAFQRARQGEANGEWAAVETGCREALAVDANHLDAAYLLAVALAKTGAAPAQIVEPLATAVAGDFAKWGRASLEQPALQGFLATPIGAAWRHSVEQTRQAFVAALARSVIVVSQGDLYAYEPDSEPVAQPSGGSLPRGRWLRLTRTSGAVVASLAIRSAQNIAYVTRQRVSPNGARQTTVGIGLVDLGAGRTRRAIDAPTTRALRVGYSDTPSPGFVVRAGTASWSLVAVDKLELRRLPAKPRIDTPIQLEVTGRRGRLARAAVDNVSADWDEHELASAIRIGTSHRVVTVPSPGLIDRNTATWSPDRTQLAFVAQLDDTCAPGVATAAAFVADAATGSVRELERAIDGIAVEWYAERTLAIAGDHGVSLVALDGGPAFSIPGADGLLSPRRQPLCSPEPAGEPPLTDDE